jgi:DNA-directed RNA polymerase specialized sigma24 family protein
MTQEERADDPAVTAGTFEEFVTVAEPRVRRALVLVGGPEAARDATADALVEVWRRWDRVREMANPAGYLFTVARRRLPRRPAVDLARLPDEVAGDGAAPVVEPRLVAALAALPERQRVAVYLVVGCGWSAPEVAALTGAAATTVRTHLDRGMARLRTELGADREEPS